MKDRIHKILNLSKKLQTLRNENQETEKQNVISFINSIPTNKLALLKDKFTSSKSDKINKIRLLVVNQLMDNNTVSSVDVENYKSQVAYDHKENILRSWKSYFSLFLPFIYQEKVDVDLKAIGEDVISKLKLDGLVKLKIVDFDGANNFGSDSAWIAIYNKNQPNQSSSLQLFMRFSGDSIDYGLYRYATKERMSPVVVTIDSFEYDQMISDLENAKQKVIDDNSYVKCWKFSPGENAVYWEAMVEQNIAAIGWGNHNFAGKSKKQLQQILSNFSSKSIGIVKLFSEAHIGDRIIAFKGRSQVVGYGVITEVGLHSNNELIPQSDFHNYHKVNWHRVDPPIVVDNTVIDTFADISNRWQKLSKAIEFQNMSFKTNINQESTVKNMPLNQILYGPPGTGKTYHTISKALEILGESTKGKTRLEIKELFDSKMKIGQIVFTTFHQSMSYEDFIEGIKPIEPRTEGQPLIYKVQDGVFKKLCNSASPFSIGDMLGNYEVVAYSAELLTLKKPSGSYVPFSISLLLNLLDFLKQKNIDLDNFDGHIKAEDIDKVRYPELELYLINGYSNVIPNILKRLNNFQSNNQNKILIIDEINRGNVSQIFGELITLIEEDKRLGKEEALEVTLPYSKEKFGVPSNLYIIGTMNTADRSVEILDAALRRRFSFEEMPPRPELIASEGKLKEKNGVLETINLPDVLNTMNKRIEKLLDKDHKIGHSYFMTVTNIDELKSTFRNKIIPLLQEYFYGDYAKIGLVLGHGFFETIETVTENLFANFDDYDTSDFSERPIYRIKDVTGMSEADFHNAINILLKKQVEN